MPKKNVKYVTFEMCREVSGSIKRDVEVLRKVLIGENAKSGVVADILKIKEAITQIQKFINDQMEERKQERRNIKGVAYAVLGSVISGVIITLLSYLLGML